MASRGWIRSVPLIAAALVAALTFELGNWQVRRAGEKEALQARIEHLAHETPVQYGGHTLPQEWQPLTVRGRWLASRAMFIDNRVHAGRAGYYLVMPMELTGSEDVLLVNRGWVPVGVDRRTLPVVAAQAGEVQLTGVARVPEAKPFALSGNQVQGVVWQNLDLKAMAGYVGRALQPFVLQQSSDTGDGLVRDWPRPDAGIERHKGYALQWYGLCALVVLLTGMNVLRRRRRNDDAQG